MKKNSLVLLCIMFLVSCNSQTIIEWVDFVKMDGKQYEVIYSAIIADYENIGEKVGEVKHKVAGNVSNPRYRVKDGDAAFLEKGTDIYSVEDRKDLIAIPDESEINGYRIYYSNSDGNNFNYHYKDINLEAINKVEIYEGDNKPQLNHTVVNEQEIAEIIAILNEGNTDASFSPSMAHGDPIRYQLVLYSEEPIANNYSLFYDGNVWYWHPWDTSIISDEIENYIK